MYRQPLARLSTLLILLSALVAACRPAASPPAPTDEPSQVPYPSSPPVQAEPGESSPYPVEEVDPGKGFVAGPVTITEMGLVISDDPYSVEINLVGTLPTPCHTLKWTIMPDQGGGRVDVDVAAVADPDQNCIQVLSSFEQRIPLTGLEPGEYEVYVNGERLGSVSFPDPS